ncbi:MAG TPA: hypothetical protein VJ249_03855 [Candidatus Bathyarchaeia archaeon]|nr:hypothetical protein [Candidatus Bathyarchaeia archaeon]
MERRIYAVHDQDLMRFLTDLNLLDRILRKELKCHECGCVITLENVGFITLSKGEVKVCCDDLECFYRFKTKAKERKEDAT